jgi:glycosyltransferase involved in cell wall biosynthesis
MDSVKMQSYPNLEIICVNDGSTDNSEAVIRKCSENDSRIVVINQKNSGVSAARNAGIEYATGDYITFADPDDILDLDAYKTAMSYFEKENNLDVVVWGYSIFPVFDTWYEKAGDVSDKLYELDSINAYFNEKSSTVVWNKIYRSALIKNNVQFKKELKYGEDIDFNLRVFPESKNIRFISDKLYNYRIKREGSATTAFERTKKLENQLIMFKSLIEDWNNLGYMNGNESKIVAHFTDLAYNELEGLRGKDLENFSKKFLELMKQYIEKGFANRYPFKVTRKIKHIKQYANIQNNMQNNMQR